MCFPKNALFCFIFIYLKRIKYLCTKCDVEFLDFTYKITNVETKTNNTMYFFLLK